MNRLDRHVATVRSRLTLSLVIEAWAWSALFFGVMVWLAIVTERLTDRSLPHHTALFWAGVGVSAIAAIIYGLIRMPAPQAAALAIDERLGLKERFSTALFARDAADPFSQAAVRDAEYAADNVSLHKRFPLQ